MFYRECEGVGRRVRGSLSRVKEGKNYKKTGGKLVPVKRLGLLNGAYLIEVRLLPSHRDWGTGALSSDVGWNKQEFFWQP